jgi:hypothetical protein
VGLKIARPWLPSPAVKNVQPVVVVLMAPSAKPGASKLWLEIAMVAALAGRTSDVNKASAVESPTRCDPAPKRVVVVVFMVEIVDFRILSGREGGPAGSMERMAGP